MKTTVLSFLLLVTITSQAFAVSTLGFKNWSASGTDDVPVTCSIITGATGSDSGMTIAGSITNITLANKTATGTMTVAKDRDYTIKCYKDVDKAAYPINMYFDSATTTVFPVTEKVLRIQ